MKKLRIPILCGILLLNSIVNCDGGKRNNEQLSIVGLRTKTSYSLYGIRLETSTTLGITDASMYGPMDTIIQGWPFASIPTDNKIVFVNTQLGLTFYGPPLSSENAQASGDTFGALSYTVHALSDLMGVQFEDLQAYDQLTFEVQVQYIQRDTQMTILCPNNYKADCSITFKRSSTPQVYYLSPRAVYQGSETSIYLDAKSSNYLVNTNAPQPDGKIDGNNLNFLDRSPLKDKVIVTQGTLNEVKAYNTDQSPNAFSMLTIALQSKQAYPMPTMPVCLPDLTCYSARTVPTVKSISTHSAYSSGGKTLTINGFGFLSNAGSPQVTIDGIICPISAPPTNTQIQCLSQGGDITQSGFYRGQQGIKRKIYSNNGASYPNYSNYKDQTQFTLKDLQLYTTIESPQNNVEAALEEYEGLFVPKVTSRHRFYASCDDRCQVYLSTDKNPANAVKILDVTSYTKYRDFWASGSQISGWISLVKDEAYYLKVLHQEVSGADHLTVGVEIEQTPEIPVNHPQSFPEIQKLNIDQTQAPDTIKWKITNPDENYYSLIFFNANLPNTPLGFKGEEIVFRANFTSGEIRNALLSAIYSPVFGSDIRVTRTQISTSPIVFEITVEALRALDTYAFTQIAVGKLDKTIQSLALITTQPSTSFGPYSYALKGYFQIKCYDFSLQTYKTTEAISVKESVGAIKERIIKACPEYRYYLEMSEGSKYKYIENGRELILQFSYHKDVPDMQIVQAAGPFVDDGDYPPVTGYDVVLSQSNIRDYSSNLFYWSIPFEMLQTLETYPQVKVSVGGLPAVCIAPNQNQNDFDCNFQYTATPQCASYIVGNVIVTDCEVPLGCIAYYGEQQCSTFTVNNPQYNGQTTCTLQGTPIAGSNRVTLKCPDGDFITGSAQPPGIDIVSITPNCLNFFGGQTITITGANFPSSLNGNTVSVVFGINNSQCVIQTLSQNTLTCISPYFAVHDQPTLVTICINDSCDDATMNFCNIPAPIVIAYFPNPVSPVLRTNMVFAFDFIPNGAFNPQDYQIYVQSVTDPTLIRYPIIQDIQKVVTINDQNVEVIEYKMFVRFLGSYSGQYSVHISHSEFGTLDTSSLPLLDVNSYIESIYPLQGSPYGGTILTITGGPFSDNPQYGILENNVKIGNTDCIVFYSDKTTIKCKTALREPTDPTNTEGSEEVDVFLKAAEYAVCIDTNNPTCHFTWSLTGLPVVESIEPIWDDQSYYYYVSIKGSGFSNDISEQLFIDGVNHPIEILNDTNVYTKLIWLNTNSTTDIEYFQAAGRPDQHWLLKTGFEVEPKFIGLNVNEGSSAGSIITATVRGIGVQLTGIDLKYGGTSLCAEIKIVNFETIECKTKPVQILSVQDVQFVQDGISFTCAHADITRCQYRTTVPTTPRVTTQQVSGDSIIFYGSYFPQTGFQPFCSYATIYGTSATINTDGSVTCTFEYGVPNSPTNRKPELWFKAVDSTIAHWSLVDTVIPGKPNPTFVANNVQCSNYGGCALTIQGTGLSSDLRNADHAYITVCGQICDFSLTQSTDTQAVCYLRDAPLSNAVTSGRLLSAESGRWEKPKRMKGKILGSIQDQAKKVFADNRDLEQKEAERKYDQTSRHIDEPSDSGRRLQTSTVDLNVVANQNKEKAKRLTEAQDFDIVTSNSDGWTSSTKNCWFGMQFDQNYVGKLTEAEYFIPPQTNVKPIINHLFFQGSNDLQTWTTLHTIGNEITKQWNQIYFVEGQEPVYNAYRFYGDSAYSCIVGKVKLWGYNLYQAPNTTPTPTTTPTPIQPNTGLISPISLGGSLNLQPSTLQLGASLPTTGTCEVKVVYDGTNQINLGSPVSYSQQYTPMCDSISPRFGTVKGGEIITIQGSNFSTNKADYEIFFDGIKCEALDGATSTEVQCLTGKRTGLMDNPYMVFRIKGKGDVVCPHIFRYVYKWSDEETWGGDGLPIENESVWIPKGLTLFVDIDHPPTLKEVVVEGNLIFDPVGPCPNEPRTFDAHYIFTKGGSIQAGTEQSFYECKLTFTLHGRKNDPEVPLYGNKVLGIRYGTLDLHGRPRDKVWVDLEVTAQIGDTQVTVIGPLDWYENDVIVIASTGYDMNEAETRTITSVDKTNVNYPIIHFADPLQYKHYAAVETYNGQTAEMRGEVGLLTRDIVIQGDEFSEVDQNGAIVSVISQGPNSSIARIQYVELRQVGQAFKKYRNPLLLFVADSMSESYLKGNSIHHSYNRGIALHSVQDLLVDHNVLFDIKGHSLILDDGTEKNNIIAHNLVMNTRIAWSLQNTDQVPASFWIRSPMNVFIGNRAAGSEAFGFWFNLPNNPQGVLYDPLKCPTGQILIQFDNNAAHSNKRVGLQQSNVMNPKLSQCAPLTLTVSVTANLNNFRSWKNSQNGVFMESIGDVRLNNFLVADNLAVNLEVAKTPHTPDGTAQIVNALIIGYSGNADATTLASSAVGLTTPRSENFQVNGAKFFNLDLNNMVPIQPCSQCNLGRDFTDSGARTVTFSQLYFQGFNRVLRYVFPRRDILLDLDGTLTGLGPNTWATPIWEHNKQPQCQESPINDSLFCDSTVEVRRIALYNYVPGSLTNAEIEILRWDEYADLPNIDYNYYENDTTKYSIIPWKTFGDPRFGWALPFVTNHAYKLHWRQGIDFTRISLDISERWQPDDSNLRLIFNHTAKREQWQVEISNVSPKELIPRDTLQTLTNTEWQSGDNAQYNASEIRQLHLLINGKNKTRKTLTIRGYECLDYCPVVPRGGGYGGDDVPCPGIRYWNVPNHWDSGYVPIQNEDVVIRRNCVFYFNVQSTPVLNSVTVYGTLIWLNDAPDLSLTMNTRVLFNRGGVIKIGEEGAPFMGKLAQVRLWGTKFTPQEAFAPQIDGGNKMIGNTGQLQMFGMPRERFARLKQVATKGTLNIRVEPGLDWQANDQIAILTTNNNWKGSEDVFIESYNDLTGEIVLKSQLLHTHWGTENPTNQQYDVDLRAEVLLLTSNVKVTSQDEGTNWGCQIVTSDTLDSLGNRVGGQLKADNIEAYNCSQFDSFRAALRFDFAMKNESYVRNSAFHHGLGYGLQISYSQNINIEDCIFYDFIQFGGNIQSSHKLILSGNFFAHIGYYENNFNYVKPNAALLICIYLDNDVCSSLMIHDNTVAGSFYAGYGAPAIDCDATIGGLTFISNIAHSVNGEGAIFMPDKNSATQLTCLEVILFKAYKNMRYGAIVVAPTKEIRFKNMVLIDNGYGTGIMMGREGNDLKVKMSNIKYYGETEHKDCEVRDQCLSSPGSCTNKVAMVLPIMLNDYNPPFPRNESLPDLLEYDASWGGKIELEDIIFSNYPSNKQFCGGQISLFEPHRDASDYTPEVIFKNAIFRGVSKDALGFFHSPNPSWNTVEECGEFGCTGLQNVIVTFKELTTLDQYDTTFGINSNAPLSLVSNNPNLNAFYEDLGCTRLPNLNGYICYTDSIGHLMFESLDSDSFQRTVSPITIVSPDLPKYKNVLNSFRDKKSSILLGQQRNSRFPLTVVAPEGTHYMYSLTYTGTVPEKQRFALRDTPSGVVVQIKYAEQNSYSVRNEDNGQLIEYNDYDKSIGKQKPITEFKVCGENRYIGVVNILEFYITPGCSLLIEPRNVVMAQVRLEWTIAEFYKDGGTTMFIDRLSAVLGIHPSYVKIVTVYEGSVIIDFRITADEDDDYAVSAIKYKLDDTLGKNTTIFGAPLLDYKVTATVKIEYPDETFQVYNSTVEVKEDSGMIGGLTTTQSLLLVVLGGVTLACVIFLLIFYTVCKKSKTVSIKVNEKDEKVPEEKKADLNLSQEYEHQYHPKTTIGKSFFNLREGEQEKPNQDSVADNEMGQGSSPASSPRVWGRETWDQGCDTVRTANGNRYNEDNILITARSQRQWPDNMETELNLSKKTSSQFTEYDSPTSLANPEK